MHESHERVRSLEPSPDSIDYIERFYTEKRPDLFTLDKISKIDFHNKKTAAHVKEHIKEMLMLEQARLARVGKLRPVLAGFPDVTIILSSPIPLGAKFILFTNKGFMFAQARDKKGRFTGNLGATSHTLRRFRTFFKQVESKRGTAKS